jgi:hypothetical protein
MSYRPHQIEASNQAVGLLQKHGLVSIFGLPRTGKTRASIRTAIMHGASNVLILTKKSAIPGWEKELAAVNISFEYTLTNYELVHKVDGNFDLVIVDESHNLGTRGKPTERVKNIRALCYNLPAVFLTGTPIIETPLAIYHQWCITKYSPFREMKSFYKFFREYGIADPVWINGRAIEQYKKSKDKLLPIIEQYAVRISQEDAGIEHQAQDVVHRVKLATKTKRAIGKLTADGVVGRFEFDTDIGIRTAVHQAEYGALLYEDELVMLPHTEVMDYLMEVFGDSGDVVYLSHFRSTREKLRQHFVHARLLSSIADAEGVDLSQARHVVIVNTGYSGAKFTQLRERLVNMNRTTEALIHHIVTDAGVSNDVYAAVSGKKDYNLAQFRSKR